MGVNTWETPPFENTLCLRSGFCWAVNCAPFLPEQQMSLSHQGSLSEVSNIWKINPTLGSWPHVCLWNYGNRKSYYLCVPIKSGLLAVIGCLVSKTNTSKQSYKPQMSPSYKLTFSTQATNEWSRAKSTCNGGRREQLGKSTLGHFSTCPIHRFDNWLNAGVGGRRRLEIGS